MDWISDKLYYVDYCNDYIGVLDLATYQYKMLINDYRIEYNSDIVVDPTTRLANYKYFIMIKNLHGKWWHGKWWYAYILYFVYY